MKNQIKIQHGDVQGRSILEVPKGAKRIENKPIALGEKTGHTHSLTGDVELFEIDGRIVAVVGNDGARLQHTHESNLTPMSWTKTTELPVADHRSHLLPKGTYEFFIQKAFNPYTKLMEKVLD